jgi:hypothetical protein
VIGDPAIAPRRRDEMSGSGAEAGLIVELAAVALIRCLAHFFQDHLTDGHPDIEYDVQVAEVEDLELDWRSLLILFLACAIAEISVNG